MNALLVIVALALAQSNDLIGDPSPVNHNLIGGDEKPAASEYQNAVDEAVRLDVPLVVWHGIPAAAEFKGAVVVAVDELPGFDAGLVVSQPDGGRLWYVATLPATARAREINAAIDRWRFSHAQPRPNQATAEVPSSFFTQRRQAAASC